MSYWGSSPAWGAARHGPSPMVPLMVVLALGWVIYNEALLECYERVTEVRDTVADNAMVFILAAGLLLLAVVLLSNQMEVVLVPMVLVLVMLLIQNIVVAALLLLLAVYLAGIYYYPPHRGYGGGGGGFAGAGGDWTGWGCGLGFYMLLLLCLVLCAMFSEEGGSWWIPGVLLAACLLCLNLFSGGKVLGQEYF
ncbi:hypothetical protein CFC21_073360 [Triticum aestivum]|uniref:Uncharacterized protein n=3 Tax=Triticum TaxID=4564 RepID=A0A9R1AQ88_TRITD|nr:uncharacterized protein LOC119311672 [Triticum dicoccoides]XP_044390281.1 uncharacterized protein LOC123113178 [Triticum aestivum]XP_044390282.1 uncharacterized protein LOC123113178 [Triticum aestivum]XP_044390283.1 uncharacterized protein LOC123113178 [Triticum aestivum]VAI36199.1 unnamed protein product [Triticum turgidum subsp. durum]KAF7067469.1 hypothetical protein CFC21_073360 [Triticum aestivum]